jgi:hypothetical protein
MVITYLRSSSIGAFSFCPQKYFCSYVLGLKDKQNGKALMGNVVHKNMELFALMRLAEFDNKRSFTDDIFGRILFNKVSPEYFNELSHAYYEAQYPGLMPKKSKEITLEWTHLALTRVPEMDPRTQNVHAVEEFFEVEVPHEWADFSYTIGDQVISGRLGLKGTVDLIVREDDIYYHIMDYKTGRRYDWGKDKIKEPQDFEHDPQLLLYYYALRLKYPERRFHVSIYYINDHIVEVYENGKRTKKNVEGGLYSFCFDDVHFARAEKMLKAEFDKIRGTAYPKLLSETCSHFKCKWMCAYSQVIPEISPDKPACLFLRDEIKKIGIDATTAKYGDMSKMSVYEGGGRTGVELGKTNGMD